VRGASEWEAAAQRLLIGSFRDPSKFSWVSWMALGRRSELPLLRWARWSTSNSSGVPLITLRSLGPEIWFSSPAACTGSGLAGGWVHLFLPAPIVAGGEGLGLAIRTPQP